MDRIGPTDRTWTEPARTGTPIADGSAGVACTRICVGQLRSTPWRPDSDAAWAGLPLLSHRGVSRPGSERKCHKKIYIIRYNVII